MASRNNRVWTWAVFKDGRIMTSYFKHKKTPILNGMPLPVPSSRQNVKRVREVAVELMKGVEIFPASRRTVFLEIESYPDELVERLHRTIMEWSAGSVRRILTAFITGKPAQAQLGRVLAAYPALDGKLEKEFKEIVDALSHYPQLPDAPDHGSDSEVVERQCYALVRATCGLLELGDADVFKSVGDCDIVIKDDAFTEMLLEVSQFADEIMTIVRERNSVDVELIRSIVTGEAPAMGNGFL